MAWVCLESDDMHDLNLYSLLTQVLLSLAVGCSCFFHADNLFSQCSSVKLNADTAFH